MTTDLTTTNVLLGIMATVSLLEALAVIGLFAAGFLMFRRVMRVVGGIEERQVAPAVARVNAILDDVKEVTATVRQETGRVERVMQWAAEACRARCDRGREAAGPSRSRTEKVS